jgi:hypothetical protein
MPPHRRCCGGIKRERLAQNERRIKSLEWIGNPTKECKKLMENGSNATIEGHEFFVQELTRKDVIKVRQYCVQV